MYSLGVLSEIVEARETPRAVTLKWALASVFSNLRISSFPVTQVNDFHGYQSYLMCLAKCSLLVKLRLHGG